MVVANFVGQAGPKVQLPHDPVGLFSLFFDDSLISLIVDETNRYAQQSLRGKNKEPMLMRSEPTWGL